MRRRDGRRPGTAPRRHAPETAPPKLHPGRRLDGTGRGGTARRAGGNPAVPPPRGGGDALSPGGTMEDAMATALGLGLSILITAALLGWLAAAAE